MEPVAPRFGRDRGEVDPRNRGLRAESTRADVAAAAPGRVTAIAAVAQPKRTASCGAMPRASAAAKPPLKASPAPVVSATGPASKAGTSVEVSASW